MNTDAERRLRAALQASAELITDSPDSAGYQLPATNPDGGDRPKHDVAVNPAGWRRCSLPRQSW